MEEAGSRSCSKSLEGATSGNGLQRPCCQYNLNAPEGLFRSILGASRKPIRVLASTVEKTVTGHG